MPARDWQGDSSLQSSMAMTSPPAVRLTQYARGGGCACKIPPGELEAAVARLIPDQPRSRPAHRRGARRRRRGRADQRRARDRGHGGLLHPGRRRRLDLRPDRGGQRAVRCLRRRRRAAGRAEPAGLAARPCSAPELAAEVLRGGLDVATARAATSRAATASTTRSPSTAWRSPASPIPTALLRIDAGRPGLPLSLTKPIGSGVLNARHKATGEVFPAAIEVMTTLNAVASQAGAGRRAHVRHRRDRLRPARPPVQAGQGQRRHRGHRQRRGAADRRRAGRAAGWLRARRQPPQPGLGRAARRLRRGCAEQLLLLADAQTSGGLLVAGEIPGAPVIGELIPAAGPALILR